MGPGDLVAGRFELLELAAKGGVGSVHRARDRATGDVVAVKLIEGVDNAGRARFVREAALLAELVHPRIAGYVGHGLEGETPYIVMRWVDGESLAQRLRRGALGSEDALVVLRGACEGLAAAHARGVVHRDVKPGNLMLQDGALERVVLVDFGIARRAVATLVTPRGSAIGTPGYMAPEQARGEAVDARADVFALGCVLYRCAAGRAPFVGADVVATLAKVLFEEAPHLSDLAPRVPRAVGDLAARLMRKDRGGRPPDAGAVLEAIDALAHLAPVTAREGPPLGRLGDEEVRVLCAVACELEPLSADADPLRRWSEAARALREAATPVRGRVEVLAGGAAVVTLEPVGSAHDQAARAARLALALAETGRTERRGVALGRGALLAPTGEVIDRAVALMRAAPRGVTLVEEGLAALVEGRFALEGSAGGARALVGETHASDPREIARRAPLVGRDRELLLLSGVWDECATERAARCAVVVGPAGVGKTRIAEELARRLRAAGPIAVWRADGDALAMSSPLAAAAEMLRGLAGVRRKDDADARRAKVRAWAQALGVVDARPVALVCAIAGVAGNDDDGVLRALRLDRVAMNDAIQGAWGALVRAQAARAPLLFLVDDAQWVDLSTLKLVTHALAAAEDLPVLLIALGRADDDAFTRALGDRPSARVAVRELSPRAAATLARGLCPGEPDAAIEALVRASGGNPLVIEELARVGPDRKAAPETVLSMTEERLAALDPEVRRALRAASVLGGRFDGADVAAVLGDGETSTTRALDAAAARGVLAPRDGAWAFDHALLREAAYATLTPDDRRAAHGRAAELLTARGGADEARVAEHWERAGRPREAVPWYARAAERALALSDCAGAVALADRGLGCGARGDARARLERLAAEALAWQGAYEPARARAERAMATAEEGGAEWHQCAAQAIVASARLGDDDGVAAVATAVTDAPARGADAADARALALARAVSALVHTTRAEVGRRCADALEARLTPDAAPLVQARAREARANLALARGDPTTYVELMADVARAYEDLGATRAACHARVNLGHVLSTHGDAARAAEILERAWDGARALAVPFLECAALHNLGLALARAGRAEEGLSIERRAVDRAIALGDARVLGGSRAYAAQILLAMGDAAAARGEGEAAARVLDPHPALCAAALAVVADAALAQGEAGAALEAASRAMAVVEEHGGALEEGEAAIRLAHARALHALGRSAEARAAIATAAARLDARSATLRGALAEAFERVPEHARTRALARAWA